jgi:hypothetical protein
METSFMKNLIIGGLICIVAVLVIGFEPVQRTINEATNRGTLRGVENCMIYSSSELLSEEAVRAICTRTFQKQLYSYDHATGRAGPWMDQRTVGWTGTLQNNTPDHVTTWIKILVSIYDAEGIEQEFSAETPIWIDPLDEAEFRVELPGVEREQLEDIEFCDQDAVSPTACMKWGVTDMMGLAL